MSSTGRSLAADVEAWVATLALVPAPVPEPRPLAACAAGALLASATRPVPTPTLDLELVRADRRTHLAPRYADRALCGAVLDTVGPRGDRVSCPVCAAALPPEAD